MTRRHPTMCVLGVWMPTHYIKVFKTPNKGAWLGIFQPNWQSHKIATSPTANIGSTSNFHRTTEQHSRLRGWSRMTKFQFKMAVSRHIEKCLKCYNSSTSGAIWTKLGWSHTRILSSPRRGRHDAVAMVTAVA